MDPKSGKLVFAKMTNEYVHDTEHIEELLKRTNRQRGHVLFDGIADSKRCYEIAKRYNKRLLTPPKKRAVIREKDVFRERNDAIRIIHGLGGDKGAKSLWGKLVGYSRRVIVESMMSRWKQLFGSCLRSICDRRREIEVQLKSIMINKMIDQLSA